MALTVRAFANGFPKHGNHALVKSIQLLGVNCDVNHEPFGAEANGPRVFVKRDPRNAVVSWLRFNGKPVTQGMVIAALADFDGKPLVDAMQEFEGWLTDSGTLVVRFEDLIASDGELRRIAEHLGVPYLDDAFPALPAGTVTWSGKLSDYRAIWSTEVQRAWAEAGGNEVLHRWGY
jgi:hypothetical protein